MIDTTTEQIMLVLLCLSVIGNILAAWLVPTAYNLNTRLKQDNDELRKAIIRERDLLVKAKKLCRDAADFMLASSPELRRWLRDMNNMAEELHSMGGKKNDTHRTRNNDDAEQPDPTDDTGDDMDGNWSHLDRAAADTEAANGSEFFHQVVARHHMANPRGCGVTNCCFCRAAEKKKRGMENT